MDRLQRGAIMSWERFWSLKPESLILWLAVLAAMIAIAAYLVLKFRAKTLQHEPRASEMLSKFRELHSRGELTDEEFRTIKTTLTVQLQKELNDNGKTG